MNFKKPALGVTLVYQRATIIIENLIRVHVCRFSRAFFRCSAHRAAQDVVDKSSLCGFDLELSSQVELETDPTVGLFIILRNGTCWCQGALENLSHEWLFAEKCTVER